MTVRSPTAAVMEDAHLPTSVSLEIHHTPIRSHRTRLPASRPNRPSIILPAALLRTTMNPLTSTVCGNTSQASPPANPHGRAHRTKPTLPIQASEKPAPAPAAGTVCRVDCLGGEVFRGCGTSFVQLARGIVSVGVADCRYRKSAGAVYRTNNISVTGVLDVPRCDFCTALVVAVEGVRQGGLGCLCLWD